MDEEDKSNDQAADSSSSGDKAQNADPSTNKSINDYYGHKIGFFQTLSLVLNALLMVYAQVGQSGIVLSSLNPNPTIPGFQATSNNSTAEGMCNVQDLEIYKQNGGNTSLPAQVDYCTRSYNGGCILNGTCIEVCFQDLYGYSSNCTTCIQPMPSCGIASGCALNCIVDGTASACVECLRPCIDDFHSCTGLPAEEFAVENQTVLADDLDTATISTAATGASALDVVTSNANNNQCNNFDSSDVESWYTVYNLTYGKSIADAWRGGAKFLAIIIVLFSGIWPYVKNIILVVVWYMPMTIKMQTSILLWLSRLSKYTLVDVFAVIGVIVGVQLQLNLGGVEVITRAEPRFGIIAFFLATLWEFIQIELIKFMHERKVFGEEEENSLMGGERLFFARLWIPVLMLLATISLYVVGAMSEFIYIESSNGSGGICLKSYNLVSVGNALVNELSLTGNISPGQTWFLYLVYVLLILAFPVLTHTMQIAFLVARSKSKTLKKLIRWASAISCFASVEVLLIGAFAVESKFEEFIKSIAGDENTDLIDIKSGLGSGFYILIPYCFVASFLQMSLLVRRDVAAEPTVVSSREADVNVVTGIGTPTEGLNVGVGSDDVDTKKEVEKKIQE
mmetsp:Transcript_20880/g.29909  ORF Transcript_20880/g.29909 Transcript_20880/m.29909 type:complete len:621 (+) Transcript_20880:388-2250(+)|eukprot:CAMPEP_0201705928 /NCGR_PEP_ID=MMETSP0578-20130828/47291_1 /ASSEMBLY_ACC=CAM_ASM_000663 /TAXON_ID=267565 /ORGANISM="Skeletonema grethea, Strain CCMP 1804" /LENGTH=620 /DNA_ID=CAMNT_0048194273 /DNA_START=296 /DNA_END=2158 /DNA_ORIENTATION=+